MNQKYIAVDLGAESGRVMLGEVSEGGISLSELHRFPNLQIPVPHEKGRTLHWDILRLWNEIRAGLSKAADAAGAGEIRGIAVDVWGVDFGLLDEDGALVANPVCYRDARTEGMVEAVFGRLSKERIYSITGIQTMALNTLFQLASLSFGKSPQLKAARRILFLPDLLMYWLSGQMGTEYTIASTSQMLDARRRDWSPEILTLLNIDKGIFPPVQMPGQGSSIRGKLLPVANEKLAAAGVPVIAVGSHDTASAVAAVPADEARGDWLYLSSGTWSLLGAEVDEPVLTEKAMAYNVTNEGGVGGKIRLLKNIAGLFLLQECRREWAKEGKEYDYGKLTEMAEGAAPRAALLDLDDPAFWSPGEMPGKIVAHCRRSGQKVPGTPGEYTRLILESLAASYAKVARMMEELTGKKFKTLHIVGGGSQNNLLNQLAADATGMTVLAGPVEATALGNILTQAIATGALPSIAAGRALVARSLGARPFEPRKSG
jgi:sugar (pentulose or hexulose) kinase